MTSKRKGGRKEKELKRKKEISVRVLKEREKLIETESLTRSEDLDEKEKKIRMDVEVAGELLNEAPSK